MKWKKIATLVVLIAALVEGFRYRVYAENWYWHLRHGDSLIIDEYRVPVPGNWFVQDMGEKDRLLINLDTKDRTGNPPRDKKSRFHALVSVSVINTVLGPAKMEKIRELQAARVKGDGADPVFRNFDLGGESLSCVGGETFSQLIAGGHLPSTPATPQIFENDPRNWDCLSPGRLMLHITATDADMPQIWEMVSHIRKSS